MKLKILFSVILLFSFVSNLQAQGRTKKHRFNHRSNSRIVVRYHTYPRWHHNYWNYNYYWSYRPAIVKPTNMVLADAGLIMEQIEKLKEMQEGGIITEKEFGKVKKRLLNRIGELIPINKVDNSAEAVSQLEKLFELEQRDILTEKEYDKQKKKMLNVISN
jgi:hypothetical protein